MWKFLPAALLFLLALLLFFKAPTNFFWRVSVLLTEFSWLPILVTLIVFGVQWYMFPKNYILLASNLFVFALFLRPTISTYLATSNLAAQLKTEFGSKTGLRPKSTPFSFWESWKLSPEKVDFQEIIYQTIDDQDYTFHYFQAASKEKAPLVIVIHGGSWRQGDATQIPELNSYLANRNINVAAINYRFAPKYQYPAPVEDLEALITHLKARAEHYGIDTNKIILLGRSAGGQIALQAAYGKLKKEISGVISFYAPADMLWGAKQITNDWVLDVDLVLKEYIGCSVKENEDKYEAASAPRLVDSDSPPTLLIHGQNDCMVYHQHSVRLMKALKKHKVKSLFIQLPFATHGCDYNFFGPSGQVSTFAIERFIANLTHNSNN